MVNIKANFCKFADNSKLCLAFIRVPRGYRNFTAKEIAQTHFFNTDQIWHVFKTEESLVTFLLYVERPFPIALSKLRKFFPLQSGILHFVHAWTLFRIRGNIWANAVFCEAFVAKTVYWLWLITPLRGLSPRLFVMVGHLRTTEIEHGVRQNRYCQSILH